MAEPGRVASRAHISTIEWDMMDKTKFLPLSMLSSFCVRCTLYPLTLIKTRLQIQKHGEMYKGMRVFFFCENKRNDVCIIRKVRKKNVLYFENK